MIRAVLACLVLPASASHPLLPELDAPGPTAPPSQPGLLGPYNPYDCIIRTPESLLSAGASPLAARPPSTGASPTVTPPPGVANPVPLSEAASNPLWAALHPPALPPVYPPAQPPAPAPNPRFGECPAEFDEYTEMGSYWLKMDLPRQQ